MEFMFVLAVFITGLMAGVKLCEWKWKGNAKTYIGIDGYKVVPMDFYDYDITVKYQYYLQNQPKG